MNENIETQVTETETVENPVVETQETEVVSSDTKSLAKDLGEMAVVGLIIYVFCKAVDWVIDKIKAGIRKFKADKAAKKAAAAQQEQPTQAPVAAPQTPAEGTETEQQ